MDPKILWSLLWGPLTKVLLILQNPPYIPNHNQDPMSLYRCNELGRCPGGTPGSCAGSTEGCWDLGIGFPSKGLGDIEGLEFRVVLAENKLGAFPKLGFYTPPK